MNEVSINRMENVAFTKIVSKNSNVILKERIKAEGTVEGLVIRFYPGQQRALQVIPQIMHKGKIFEPIVRYVEGGNQFLAGDNDELKFNVSLPVENDDEIWITAINTDLNYDYDLVCYVTLDYLGGMQRM